MKKIENGIYEHIQEGLKFKCIKGSDVYTIKVWDEKFNRYVKCGTGTSIASCKRMINYYLEK